MRVIIIIIISETISGNKIHMFYAFCNILKTTWKRKWKKLKVHVFYMYTYCVIYETVSAKSFFCLPYVIQYSVNKYKQYQQINKWNKCKKNHQKLWGRETSRQSALWGCAISSLKSDTHQERHMSFQFNLMSPRATKRNRMMPLYDISSWPAHAECWGGGGEGGGGLLTPADSSRLGLGAHKRGMESSFHPTHTPLDLCSWLQRRREKSSKVKAPHLRRFTAWRTKIAAGL